MEAIRNLLDQPNVKAIRKRIGVSGQPSAAVLVKYSLLVMQDYLTNVWGLSFTHAAGIMNCWDGISMVIGILFLLLAETCVGHFLMLVLSNISQIMGLVFVITSLPPVLASFTGTCNEYKPQCIGHTQKEFFYIGMALLAVGKATRDVSLFHFFWKQIDPQMVIQKKKDHFIYRHMALIFSFILPLGGYIFGSIESWSLLFGVPAIYTAFTVIFFLSGWHIYEKVELQGSPLINVFRVFVASASKRSIPFPRVAEKFYKKDNEKLRSFLGTRALGWLEKAAIILPDEISPEGQVKNRWKLCSVSEVEEAKIVVRMVPVWATFIVCGIVSSIGNTYFLEQASNMNRKIGKWEVPIPLLYLLFELADIVFTLCVSWLSMKSRTYGPPVGIGVAMIFSVLCCVTAARIEKMRLNVIRNNGLLDKPDEDIPMCVFWLVFQFVLLAGLDSFFRKSIVAFYNNQAPESMTVYLLTFANGVHGLGFICGTLSVYIVGEVSEKVNKTNWFQYTLNKSRLDRYYWVLAALSSVNLIVFAVLASSYRYKKPEGRDEEIDDGEPSYLPTDRDDEDQQCCCFS